MKTCGALLVLLCCCLAETQLLEETNSTNDVTGAAQRTEDAATASTQQTCQPDIHTVLREMSNLVAVQGVELRYTMTQMEALENRLRASEIREEALENRLRDSEIREEALESRVNATLRENAESKVAFSVSLETTAPTDTSTGPFNTGITLVYKHIFLNTGNAYNSNTGFFTAPVKGVYDFNVHASRDRTSSVLAAHLRRNRQTIIIVYSSVSAGFHGTSNGVSVLLEVGDVVDVYLPANRRIVDNRDHHTTFRGHLVFKF